MPTDPRKVTVAFSVEQLESAGISDDIDDDALAEIVDDFMLTYPDLLAELVDAWIDEHQVE